MKKQIIGIVFIALVLIIGILIGIIVGQNVDFSNQRVEGSYKTDTWNGGSAALIIKKDGTCMYPTGASGAWIQDKDRISITLNDGYRVNADIVGGGILLHGHFFEKVK